MTLVNKWQDELEVPVEVVPEDGEEEEEEEEEDLVVQNDGEFKLALPIKIEKKNIPNDLVQKTKRLSLRRKGDPWIY
jgi:hypothetical protein